MGGPGGTGKRDPFQTLDPSGTAVFDGATQPAASSPVSGTIWNPWGGPRVNWNPWGRPAPQTQQRQSQQAPTQQPGGMSYEDFLRLQQQGQRAAAQASQQAAALAARQQHQSVFDWVRSQFQSWGMGDLGGDVVNILRNSRSPEQAIVEIRQTDAYKQRFAGNIARAKAGMGMLTEGDYLATESAYRQAMHQAGLPKGFYNSPSDFSDWIAKDISPAEIARRAELAGNLATTKDPQLWKELESRGISKGDAAAYMLDPDRALPAIEKKLAGAEIGAEARAAGMDFKGNNAFENKLVDKGISRQEARQAFAHVEETSGDINRAASMYGEDRLSDKQLAKAALNVGGRAVKREIKSLASRERAQFGGKSGGTGAFSPSSDL